MSLLFAAFLIRYWSTMMLATAALLSLIALTQAIAGLALLAAVHHAIGFGIGGVLSTHAAGRRAGGRLTRAPGSECFPQPTGGWIMMGPSKS